MNQTLKKEHWHPRKKALIFADEDVDGICSAAIVGKQYDPSNSQFIFVNARNLSTSLKSQFENSSYSSDKSDLDVFIVDVGINQANIDLIIESANKFIKDGSRVLYFDSHSNKYKGKNLVLHLLKIHVNVFSGKIGVAAASIVQDFLGSDETSRLRLLGALSDREIKITKKYKHEKSGLRAIQAAVAWGAYKNVAFLDKITRRLIRHPDLDIESDREILEYAIKANNHRDNLLRHVHRTAKILQISDTPRIICVTVMDRTDFGKARGTIAGRLAGEWASAIILITRSTSDNKSYAVTIRNSYVHKLDLEILGQLASTENSGGSKGAYRLTINKDNLMAFLSKVQAWSRSIKPPWLNKNISNKSKWNRNYKRSKKNNGQKQRNKKNPIPPVIDIIEDEPEYDYLDLTDLD